MRTLYRNGRVYSPAVSGATALVVEDGTVAWVGTEQGVGGSADTVVVDLAGALVTPAFVDAHVHATSTGLALTGLELSGCSTLRAVLDAVERAARTGGGRPILGGGWDETSWPEGRPPTAAELDRVDVHSAVVSSVLAASVPDLAALSGYRADGWLTRDAHDAVRMAALAGLRQPQIRDAQRAALSQAASLGIACVHEMAGPSVSSTDDLAGLLAMADAEALPEVVGYWGELFGIATARELGAVGAGGDLFCDGSLGSHTAALNDPYADRAETSGALRFDTADLAEHIVQCAEAGLQAGFHAIGDAAIDQILDAIDLVTERLGRTGGAGHRLEHAEMVRDPQRLATSGLVASLQPAFDAAWGGPHRMYAQRLGAARAAGLNRFADLAAAGVPLAFGSDSPVTPLGPWEAVRAAVWPSDPGAAISPAAAFQAHTTGGWRAAGRPGEGTLRPGAAATFAVWRLTEQALDDPGSVGLPDLSPAAELPECVHTVRRGTTIFDAGLRGG